MISTINYPGIKRIEFMNSSAMFVYLNNDRTINVPLDKFPSIKNLTAEEKKSFEIIDDKYLSFLAIDDVFGVEELIGL